MSKFKPWTTIRAYQSFYPTHAFEKIAALLKCGFDIFAEAIAAKLMSTLRITYMLIIYIVSERKRTFWKSARTIFSLPIDNLKI